MMLGYKPDGVSFGSILAMALASLHMTAPLLPHSPTVYLGRGRSPGGRAHRAWRRRRAAGRTK